MSAFDPRQQIQIMRLRKKLEELKKAQAEKKGWVSDPNLMKINEDPQEKSKEAQNLKTARRNYWRRVRTVSAIR